MTTQVLKEILPTADLIHVEVIEKHIQQIDKAKTHLIFAVTGELEEEDQVVFFSLRDLSVLQNDLLNLKENIENHLNEYGE